jgi:hypothetical protein
MVLDTMNRILAGAVRADSSNKNKQVEEMKTTASKRPTQEKGEEERKRAHQAPATEHTARFDMHLQSVTPRIQTCLLDRSMVTYGEIAERCGVHEDHVRAAEEQMLENRKKPGRKRQVQTLRSRVWSEAEISQLSDLFTVIGGNVAQLANNLPGRGCGAVRNQLKQHMALVPNQYKSKPTDEELRILEHAIIAGKGIRSHVLSSLLASGIGNMDKAQHLFHRVYRDKKLNSLLQEVREGCSSAGASSSSEDGDHEKPRDWQDRAHVLVGELSSIVHNLASSAPGGKMGRRTDFRGIDEGHPAKRARLSTMGAFLLPMHEPPLSMMLPSEQRRHGNFPPATTSATKYLQHSCLPSSLIGLYN